MHSIFLGARAVVAAAAATVVVIVVALAWPKPAVCIKKPLCGFL